MSSRRKNRKYILASAVLLTVLGAGVFTLQTREKRIEETVVEVSYSPAAIKAARPLLPGRTVTTQDLGWKDVSEDELGKLIADGAFIARDAVERQSLSVELVGRSVLSLVPSDGLVTSSMISAAAAQVAEQESIDARSQYPLTADLAVFVTRHGLDLDYLFVEKQGEDFLPIAMGRPARNDLGAMSFTFTPDVVERLVQVREAGQLYLQLDSRQVASAEDGEDLSISRSEMSWFGMTTGKFQFWSLSDAEGISRFRRISTDFDLIERDGRFVVSGIDISSSDFFGDNVFLLNKREIMELGSGACVDGMCSISTTADVLSQRLLSERYQRIAVQRQSIGIVEKIGDSIGANEKTPETSKPADVGVLTGTIGEK